MLKFFKTDPSRDLLAPEFQCYQMDLGKVVDDAINAGELVDLDKAPTWAKTYANPIKAKGFIVRMFQNIFLGTNSRDEVSLDYQAEIYDNKPRVSMWFTSANIRNENLEMFGNIAREALPAYEVIVLAGCMKHNGETIRNANAQKVVNEILESHKPTLIIAAQMAQRSFSIPEITQLILAYDNGAEGATIQKMSRALTPSDENKVGKIFSLSFDPNRDDKFDSMIVETALNIRNRSSNPISLMDALRNVLKTIDIFKCTEDGAVKMNHDTYLEEALERKGISRVLGKIANVDDLDPADIAALANGNVAYTRADAQDSAKVGKKTNVKQQKGAAVSTTPQEAKDKAKVREMIVTFLDNMDIILAVSPTKKIPDAIEAIRLDRDLSDGFVQFFGVGIDMLEALIAKRVINPEWMDILYR